MAAPAVLTGHKISLSYDRLLHIPNLDGGDGKTVYTGLGDIVNNMIIDITADDTNGGFFVVNFHNSGYGIAGFQNVTRNVIGGGTTEGLSFMTDSTHVNTLWIGSANGQVAIGYINSDIPAEVSGYNLYVKDGITSENRIQSGVYNGFANLPNIGRGSNYYYLTANNILQLGNDDEIFSSGTSDFTGDTGGGNVSFNIQLSNQCQESSISGFTVTLEPKMRWSSCRIHWIRIGQIVHCTFVVSGPVGSSSGCASGLEGNIIPLPVMTSRGNAAAANIDPFGSGVAYVPNWDNPSGNFHYANKPGFLPGDYSGDEITVPVEIKKSSPDGGGDYSRVVILQHWYTGSSGSTSGIRGTFTYQLE